MLLCFDIFNIHGVLMLFNACVKISSGFVGGQLFFLLHAHLPLEIKSPRSLSEFASHVLDSIVTKDLLHSFFSQVLLSHQLRSDSSPFTT